MTQGKCPKCDGSGLIPFTKNRKVIPNTFLHCDCHPVYGDNPKPDRYHHLTPDMFDYPMSDTFRGYSYQYCGVTDPGYIPPELPQPEPQVREVIHRHSDMSQKDYEVLQQLRGQVRYLQSKVEEGNKRYKPVNKATGYKGLTV